MRVQLLQVLKKSDTRISLIFADDFAERRKNFLTIVGDQDRELGHIINRKRLRNWR